MTGLLILIGALSVSQLIMWEQRRPRPHPYEPKHAKE